MSRNLNYGKNTFWQALGRVIYIVTGFIFFVFIARWFGPEILGYFAWASAFLYISSTVADLSSTGAFALLLGKNFTQRDLYYGNYLIIRGISATIVMLISIPIAYQLAPDPVRLPLILMCLLLPLIAARFFEPVFQVYQKPWLTLWLNLTYTFVLFIGGLTVYLIGSNPIFGIIVAFGLAGAVYGLEGLFLTMRLAKPKLTFNRHVLIEMLQIIGPVGVSSFFSLINTRIDVFFLEAMRTTSEVGLYNAAFRFLDVGAAVAVTLITPMLPILGSLAARNRDLLVQLYRNLLQWTIICGLIIAIITPLLSTHILWLAFGETYTQSDIVINILSWKFLFVCINILTFGTLASIGNIGFAYWNTAVATAINMILNYFLIPEYGISGAAIATLISEIFLVSVVMFYLHRSIGSALSWKWLVILIIASITMLVIEFYLYSVITELPAIAVGLLVFTLIMYFTKAVPNNPKNIIKKAETIPHK